MAVSREFFEVTAQVIPVLLLAGLVEYPGTPEPVDDDARQHAYGGPERRLALTRLVMVAALVWAEIASLTAIAGYPTRSEFVVAVGGLTLGAAAVVERVFHREVGRLIKTMRRGPRVAVVVAFWAAVVGVPLGVLVAAAF